MAKPPVLEWVFAEYPRARTESTPDASLHTVPLALSAVLPGLAAVSVVIAVAVAVMTLFR